MEPKIVKNGEFIEVIGHYDNEVLCAKMTLLADLYAVEHRSGYAKFKVEDEDKLKAVDEKLEFRDIVINVYSNDGTDLVGQSEIMSSGYTYTITSNGFSGTGYEYDYAGSKTFLGLARSANAATPDSGLAVGDSFTTTNSDNNYYIVEQSSQVSVDLSTLSGWDDLSSGTHSIQIKAKGTGYADSELSTAVSVEKSE